MDEPTPPPNPDDERSLETVLAVNIFNRGLKRVVEILWLACGQAAKMKARKDRETP